MLVESSKKNKLTSYLLQIRKMLKILNPCQGAPKHYKIDMTNHEIYGKVQDQADSIKGLNGESTAIKQGSC